MKRLLLFAMLIFAGCATQEEQDSWPTIIPLQPTPTIIPSRHTGDYYQRWMKPACEICGKGNSILNRLNVHHFYVQHHHPELANVELNTITLCRRCHLVAHRGNFRLEWFELALAFGRNLDEIKAGGQP